MAQHDYAIDNGSGYVVRSDLNSVLQAILTINSGATAPVVTQPGMFWGDTSGSTYYYLKQRNHSNDAWVSLFRYALATKTIEPMINGVSFTDVFTKTNLGLGNVDNTSDANKPVSTATQTALNAKAPTASPTFTGTVTLPSTTSVGNISSTELSYLDGASSNIQSQLNVLSSTSSGRTAGGAVYENSQYISANYTMTTGYNGMSVSPLTINDNVTVTIPTDSSWVIL